MLAFCWLSALGDIMELSISWRLGLFNAAHGGEMDLFFTGTRSGAGTGRSGVSSPVLGVMLRSPAMAAVCWFHFFIVEVVVGRASQGKRRPRKSG